MGLLAIIGGSGFTSLPSLTQIKSKPVETPYGATSAPVTRGRLAEREVLFLPRQGPSHHQPPHRIY